MENEQNEELKPKIEKISLKELRAETQKQEDEEFEKLYKELINSYKALTPSDKEILFGDKK